MFDSVFFLLLLKRHDWNCFLIIVRLVRSWTNTGKEQGMHETILSQWTTSLLSMEKKKEKVIGQCILHTPYTSWLAVMISLKIKLWFLCKSGVCKKHFPCDRCIYMDVKKSDSYMNVHLTKTISKSRTCNNDHLATCRILPLTPCIC